MNTTDSRVELLFDVANSSAFGPTLRARALERLAARLVDGVITIVASEHVRSCGTARRPRVDSSKS